MREIIIDEEAAQLFEKIATSDKIDTRQLFEFAQRDPNEFRAFLARMGLEEHPEAKDILQSLDCGGMLTLSYEHSENPQQKTETDSEARDDFGMYGTRYRDRDTYGRYRPRLAGAGTLIGWDVYNPKGEDLGDIKEIILDMDNGKVAYAVLSFEGFLGMGDKLFAVPWNALLLDTENKCFILNEDKKRLDSAPGFDKDNWPDMADPSWQRAANSFYGATSYSDTPYTDTNTQSTFIGDKPKRY